MSDAVTAENPIVGEKIEIPHVQVGNRVDVIEVDGPSVSDAEIDHGKVETFVIILPGDPNRPEGAISIETPVAQALMSKSVGEIATADTPDGLCHFYVVAIHDSSLN